MSVLAADRTEVARNFAYDVFISYSRYDKELATKLRHEMQSIGKPLWRRRMHRIYFDETSLGLDAENPGLRPTLIKAIDDSEHLVVLLSPTTAASHWAGVEIGHYAATRGEAGLLPVLTGGELRWDTTLKDFTADSTACPPALRSVFTEEPKYVDLRWFHDRDYDGDRDGRLRDDTAQLLTAIRNESKDQIVGADLRAHRRNIATMAIAAGLLLVVVVAALLLRNQSETNRRLAESETVAATATSLAHADATQALLLAAAASGIGEADGTSRGLFSTLAQTPGVNEIYRTGDSLRSVAASADGEVLVLGDTHGTVTIRRPGRVDAVVDTGRRDIREIVLYRGQADHYAFAAGGDGAVWVIDIDAAIVVDRIPIADKRVLALALDRDRGRLFVGTERSPAHIVDLDRREVIGAIGPQFFNIRGMAVVGDRLVIAGRRDERRLGDPIAAIDLNSEQEVASARSPNEVVEDCPRDCLSSFSTAAAHPTEPSVVVLGGLDGTVMSWDLKTGEDPRPFGLHDDHVARVRAGVSAGRAWLVSTGFDHTVKFWDAETLTQIGPTRLHHGGQVWDATAANGQVATVSEAGTIAFERPFDSTPAIGRLLHDRWAERDLREVEVAEIDGAETVVVTRHNNLVVLSEDGDVELSSDGATIVGLAIDDKRGIAYTAHGDKGGTITEWDLRSHRHTTARSIGLTPAAIAISPDGAILAAIGTAPQSDTGEVRFVALEENAVAPATLDGLDAWAARSVAFTLDGDTIVVAGRPTDGALYAWPSLEPINNNPLATYFGLGVSVGAEGAIVIGSDRQTIDILDRATGSLQSLPGPGSTVNATAVRTRQPAIAAGSGDTYVRLFDNGERQAPWGPRLVGHSSPIIDMAFSPDGAKLYSLSTNEVIEWNLDSTTWPRLACDIVDGDLTEKEWRAVIGPSIDYVGACADLE